MRIKSNTKELTVVEEGRRIPATFVEVGGDRVLRCAGVPMNMISDVMDKRSRNMAKFDTRQLLIKQHYNPHDMIFIRK